MASIKELLEQLTTEEAAILTGALAAKLKASKEGTLKQLTREKDKGHVEGTSQEGWLITEAGRKALEKGDIHPSMIDEGVTPKQQFQAIGQRIGIKEDRLVLATDIVWSGDFNDIKWVWEALGQADIAVDLRSVWVNSWRAKLHKGIPSELETELVGTPSPAAEGGPEAGREKVPARDYVIVDEQPVRVGPNLGDYSLQDAKDILSIRALRGRFSGAGQPAAGQPAATTSQLPELLNALHPYLDKGADVTMLKEILADKLELQRREILSHIPQPGQPAQPKTFMGQISEFITALGTLKEAGPTLRSILGISEPSNNPSSTPFPVSVKGPDGTPVVMDLGAVINFKRFESEERRADGRHDALVGMVQTVRENLPDGIQALLATVAELKGGTGAKPSEKSQEPPPQRGFVCGDCKTQFNAPPGWTGEQPLKCPNPACGREYSKEELLR